VQSAAGDSVEAVVEFDHDEIEWRKSLDVGTTIDVLKQDLNSKTEMWTKGTITAVTGSTTDLSAKNLVIKWDKDVCLCEGKFPASSPFITAYNTKSAC
jgi:hypothetical protein